MKDDIFALSYVSNNLLYFINLRWHQLLDAPLLCVTNKKRKIFVQLWNATESKFYTNVEMLEYENMCTLESRKYGNRAILNSN